MNRAAQGARPGWRGPHHPHPVSLSTGASRTDREGGLAEAMSIHIDINCDMGESYGRWTLGADEEIMPNITSANIACGFHGGDPHLIRKTGDLAVQHRVAVGAHPG